MLFVEIADCADGNVLFSSLSLEQFQMFRALFARANYADDDAVICASYVSRGRLALPVNRRSEYRRS